MLPLNYRDLIVRAAKAYADSLQRDAVLLHKLADQFAEAARAHEILRAKGYGSSGTSLSATAGQVPPAPVPPPTRIVTDCVHPDRQDAYNRKHQLGAYDPRHIALIEAHHVATQQHAARSNRRSK